jgi:hypothetical protein
MAEVGRELEREQHVVERQNLAHVGADGRVFGQREQPGVIVGHF